MEPYGIPTRYKGVQYRSRLEARWAVFFELLGWKAIYEPEDLQGWIPDFAIIGASTTYAEIKPLYEGEDSTGHVKKILAATPQREVLLLGTSIGDVDEMGTGPRLGQFVSEEWGTGPDDLAILTYYTAQPPGWDFHAMTGSYKLRIRGIADGDHHLHDTDAAYAISQGEALWIDAGNVVQYKAPK